MRVLLGSVAVCSLLIAGCGEQRAPTTTADPTGSPTTTSSTSATTSEPATDTPTPPPTPAHTPSPPTPGHVVETIPDDFPLLDGYPAEERAEPGEHSGREGPSRSTKPVVPEACGAKVPVPAHTDSLRAGWTNPEDFRQRQLLAFADAGQAQAYADDVLDVYRACPREVTSEEVHESLRSTVGPGQLGDFAGVVTSAYYYDDYPHPGMVVTHVVRVGTAVLVSITYNEAGGGGYPDREAAEQRADSARQITGVVDAMDVFGRAGTYPSEPPFGPEGFGQVTLGMPRDELLALPGVRITGNNGQCDWFEAPGVEGGLQPGLGVAVLFVGADLETPERIHVGSTLDEARTAYPHGSYGDPWFSVPIPEYGDRSYRFEVGRGERVITVMLLHDDQHCGG